MEFKSLAAERVLEVATETYLRVALRHARRIEARAVRIDARPDIRVTLQAVCLLVARRAVGEILARRATVLEQPERLCIVVHRAADSGLCRHADLLVAATAEGLGGVARAALGVASVGLRRVARDEIGRMVSPSGQLTDVTIGAETLGVAVRALRLTRRSNAAVRPRERRGMHLHLVCRRVGLLSVLRRCERERRAT